MALSQSAVSELLDAFRAGDGVDLIRESVRMVLQELIEVEADRADRRRPLRTHRDPHRPNATAPGRGCCRPRPATSSCGSRSCARASFFPSILEPRRRIDQALYAVVMEAYVARRVDPRRSTTWSPRWASTSGISKSEVSRICAGLDEVVGAFRTRRLGPHRVPLRLPRRHLPARPQRQPRPGRVDGRRGRHRDHRRRRPGGPRPRRRRQRGRGVLARRSCARLQAPRPGRGAAGHLRPARRPGRRAAPLLPGRRASTLPGPLRPQPARPGPQVAPGHGRRGVPHDLRPTRPRHRRRDLGRGPRPARPTGSPRSAR